MIKEILKKQKGISLVSLSVSVIILLTITGMIIYNVTDNLGVEKLKKLQSDIDNLNNKVATYYAEYGDIPVIIDNSGGKVEYTNTSSLEDLEGANDKGADNKATYYVINLSLLDNLTLNYGEDYETIKEIDNPTTTLLNDYSDVYIINEESHNVFYAEGVIVDGKSYYTNYTEDDIDTEEVDLKYIDGIKIPEGYSYVGGNLKDSNIKIKSDTGNKTYTWIVVNEDVTGIPTGITVESGKEQESINSINGANGYFLNDSDNSDAIFVPGVWSGEKTKNNTTINGKSESYKNPIIPRGFKVKNENNAIWGTETGYQYGLVIEDESENEFVWIPVENAEEICQKLEESKRLAGDTGVITKVASKSEILEGQIRVTPGDTSGYREPDLVVGNGSQFDIENYGTAGFSSIDNMAQVMVDDYNNMINSIKEHGGFYVGRYELSGSLDNPEEKGNQVVLTNKNWYEVYKACKSFSSKSVEARMIWGCQWDIVCKFITDYGDKKDLNNSVNWGNYQDSSIPDASKAGGDAILLKTGVTNYTRANNIYDIAGNCVEWTQEANAYSNRTMRGGNYLNQSNDFSASSLSNSNPTSSGNTGSGRAILYIK